MKRDLVVTLMFLYLCLFMLATVFVCVCSSLVLPGHLHNILKKELFHFERQTRDVDHWTVVYREFE